MILRTNDVSTPFKHPAARGIVVFSFIDLQYLQERWHALGGSGAYTRRPVRIRQTTLAQWQRAEQVTHYFMLPHERPKQIRCLCQLSIDAFIYHQK